jgi:hypothetical protein
MSNKITATCAILDIKTDAVISERIIGEFDTVDNASFAAHRERKEAEAVCIYNAPVEDEYEMSALEMAEHEAMWNEITDIR